MSENDKIDAEAQSVPESNLCRSPIKPAKLPGDLCPLALLLALGTFLFMWWLPFRDFLPLEKSWLPMLYYPILLITQGNGDSILPMVAKLALCLAVLFGFWLAIIRGWRGSSPGFKRALGLCALACLLSCWGLKTYNAPSDWTERGLNPEHPGLKPAVVLLAGTLSYRFTGVADQYRSGTARFEIRMRGADYYYAERWKGDYDRPGSWDALTLSLPDFSGTTHRSCTGRGHRGGGGSGEKSSDQLLVARRLWQGPEFIGAAAADEFSLRQATERFFDLKSYGRFQIPGRIEWQDGDYYEMLHIRRVEFLTEPKTNWFGIIREKYFDHSENWRELWKRKWNEAGWVGESELPNGNVRP